MATTLDLQDLDLGGQALHPGDRVSITSQGGVTAIEYDHAHALQGHELDLYRDGMPDHLQSLEIDDVLVLIGTDPATGQPTQLYIGAWEPVTLSPLDPPTL